MAGNDGDTTPHLSWMRRLQFEGWSRFTLSNAVAALSIAILLGLAVNAGFSRDFGVITRRTSAEYASLSSLNASISQLLDTKLNNLRSNLSLMLLSLDESAFSKLTTDALPSPASTIQETRGKLPKTIAELRERQDQVNYNEIGMSDVEIDLVLRHLSNVRTYLEWGSGGSMLNFARFATGRAYSIEHDRSQCEKMQKAISNDSGLTHLRYYCVPVEPGVGGWGLLGEGTYKLFYDYVNKIDDLNETEFDFVFVDGRARIPAAIKALPYILNNSIVALHDASRVFAKETNYADVWKFYDAIDSVGGKGKQGILIMQRKPEFYRLQGDHKTIQRYLNETYPNHP